MMAFSRDACVFYSQKGEELKRYNMRDGMGFDRLRKLAALPCGIITKEKRISPYAGQKN